MKHCNKVYEKYKHLDSVLSDKKLCEGNEENPFAHASFFEMWQAIKKDLFVNMSKCCNAPVKTSGKDNTTRYYVCTKCAKACDLKE